MAAWTIIVCLDKKESNGMARKVSDEQRESQIAREQRKELKEELAAQYANRPRKPIRHRRTIFLVLGAIGLLVVVFSLLAFWPAPAQTPTGGIPNGTASPDFTLPDVFGKEVSLKSLLTKGPVVISFYRGEWRPFCNIEMHGLQEALPKMRELDATLIAISPEKPEHGIIAAEKNKLTFPVLSDFGNKVARQLG